MPILLHKALPARDCQPREANDEIDLSLCAQHECDHAPLAMPYNPDFAELLQPPEVVYPRPGILHELLGGGIGGIASRFPKRAVVIAQRGYPAFREVVSYH